MYIGNLKSNRKIIELLEVIKDFPELHLKIGGKGPLYETVAKYSKKYDNIEFLGTVPYEKVMDFTYHSDAVYVMFDTQHPLTKIGFPNKFFEATATGRAIIASKGTYIGKLVEELNIGIVAEPNKQGIKKVLRIISENPSILVDLGKNAFMWGMKKYNWSFEEKKLLKYYDNLLGK